jgi:DNA topoisomerase-1
MPVPQIKYDPSIPELPLGDTRMQFPVRKGDFEGHPFRGNQYTAGEGEISSIEQSRSSDTEGATTIHLWIPTNKEVRKIAQEVAKKLDFPITQIRVTSAEKNVTVADAFNGGIVTGEFNPDTKKVTLYANHFLVTEKGDTTIAGTVAHEIQHSRVHEAMDSGKWLNFVNNNWSKLEKADGITSYSRSWWDKHAADSSLFHAACNETLAELARLKYQKKESEGFEIAKVWEEFYNVVNEGRAQATKVEGTIPKNKVLYVSYFKRGFEPSSKEDADYAKVVFADGAMLIAALKKEGATVKAVDTRWNLGEAGRWTVEKGGEGSGNFGHEGRPGLVGGSAPEGGGGGEAPKEKEKEPAKETAPKKEPEPKRESPKEKEKEPTPKKEEPAKEKEASKQIDVKDFPKDAKEISKEQRMLQAKLSDIHATMKKDLDEISTNKAKLTEVKGKLSKDTVSAITGNARESLKNYSEYLTEDTQAKADEYVDKMDEILRDPSLKDLDAGRINELVQDSIQKMVYQEVESNRQQFTDHGIRHLVGNAQRADEIMMTMSDGKAPAMGRLAQQFIMLNHDVGYTTPLVREGGLRGVMVSSDHPAFSEAIAREQKSTWNEDKIFNADQYEKMCKIIGTHDKSGIDFKDDLLGTSTRLSDNLSLFRDEKLPSMFKYVENGRDRLTALGSAAKNGNIEEFEKVRDQLYKDIDKAKLSTNMKRDLKASARELNHMSPKFTLGVLAGSISSIGNEKGKLHVEIKYDEFDSFLQQHFDMGQKQARKLLKDYGITDYSKDEYDIGGKVTLKVTGVKKVEKGDVSGHPFRGNQWTEGEGGVAVMEEEKRIPETGEAPPKDKPITLMFGGTFNPPHLGHVGTLKSAIKYMESQGYHVANVIVVPSPHKLVSPKLGERAYPLEERVELSRRSFASDIPGVVVTEEPALEAERVQGKLRRTQASDWARKKYPGTTIVAVTGEDAAPGEKPPSGPAAYAGDRGSKHEGYYYLVMPRPASGGISSTMIRDAIREGKPVPYGTMHPEAEKYLQTVFEKHPNIKKKFSPEEIDRMFGMCPKCHEPMFSDRATNQLYCKDCDAISKGDVEGHPFRGNQYTDGEGVSAPVTEGRKERKISPKEVHDFLYRYYPEENIEWVDSGEWTFSENVPLSEIEMENRPGGRDPAKVKGIAERVLAGHKMKPVVLVDTGEGKLQIADGYHRTLGIQHAGKTVISAYIGRGMGAHGPWEKEIHEAKQNVGGIIGDAWRKKEAQKVDSIEAWLDTQFYKGDEPGHPFRGNQYTTGVSGRAAKKLLARLHSEIDGNGFSYHPVHHDSPKLGFAVSAYKEREMILEPGEVGAETIQQYYEDNKDAFEKDPGAHVGGWYDPNEDRVCLDVSSVVDSEEDAIDVAIKHDQDGIYDIKNGRTIYVKDWLRDHRKEKADSVRFPPGDTTGSDSSEVERASGAFQKGDYDGHPFRGNQYIDEGESGALPESKGSASYDPETKTWKDADGSALPDHIKALRIPPAWKEVTYNKDPNADLLVTGVDSKGRTQPIYAERFKQQNADANFACVKELDTKYEEIRSAVDRDIADGRDVEEASVLRLIMTTGIRPGSEKDTGADSRAYGATTLEGRHIVELKRGLRLRFVGKSGVEQDIKVEDPAVVQDLLARKAAAGRKGRLFSTNPNKLNDYTQKQDGGGFTPKNFRTLLGTRIAQAEVDRMKRGLPKNAKEFRKACLKVGRVVAEKLGNTAAIAVQSYINPFVFSKWRMRLAA